MSTVSRYGAQHFKKFSVQFAPYIIETCVINLKVDFARNEIAKPL